MGAHETMGKPVTLPGAGGRKGHPIALSAGLREDLGSLQEEHQGLRALIRRLEQEGRMALYEMAAPCIFWNFNRPEDSVMRARAGAGAPSRFWQEVSALWQK